VQLSHPSCPGADPRELPGALCPLAWVLQRRRCRTPPIAARFDRSLAQPQRAGLSRCHAGFVKNVTETGLAAARVFDLPL